MYTTPAVDCDAESIKNDEALDECIEEENGFVISEDSEEEEEIDNANVDADPANLKLANPGMIY
jgi:hypothetical protein